MKTRMLLCLMVVCALTSYAGMGSKIQGSAAPLSAAAAGDTIYIPGDPLVGGPNAGILESTINADTNANGTRKNPNRVYALNQGQFYFQLAPITVNNPTGMLTIAGIKSSFGTTKPVILIYPVNPSNPVGNNKVWGSIKMDGIHFQAQQTNGTTTFSVFWCGTTTGTGQKLVLNNCLFEFSAGEIFDCTNETGAIGGWPYGAKFFITNCYFRNFFSASQWWGSRIFQCKHPIDTLWVENTTVTTGGLTYLQQNDLCDFLYYNHNTLINQHKYWMLSPYRHWEFITNNIFVNQNWVGEDTNVTNSGQDPDKYFMSLINIDTNNATNGLVVQGKYYAGDSNHISAALGFTHMRVYVSDNINFYDPRLTSNYYTNSKYTLTIRGAAALPSYLNWAGQGTGPWAIGNIPGQWMNNRTKAIFTAYAPPAGGFIEKRTLTTDPGMKTPAIANAAIIDSMAVWNQGQWSDARFTSGGNLTKTAYIYGDYNPQTLPGISHGLPTDTMTVGAAGITKFTDLTENFSQSTNISAIDGLPIGSLIWDDTKLAAFNSAADWAAVQAKYIAEGGLPLSTGAAPSEPVNFSLAQNYPNPFNPTTTIDFTLPRASNVELKVYNVLGQEVATLVHGAMPQGLNSVKFDASRLASGMYIYKLTAGSFVSTKKMMLLK